MKKIFTILSISILLFSCSNVLNKTYSEDTFQEDMIELKKSTSEENVEKVFGYILMSSFTNKPIIGKTYQEIINEADKITEEKAKQEAEEKALAEKAKAEEMKRIEKLNKSLTVTLFDKGFSKGDWESYLTYKFAFENKTDKDIKAFKGLMIIKDLFDGEITKVPMVYDGGVKANSIKNWDATTEYNQYNDSDKQLKNKEMKDLKISWTPEKIIFEDGSTLE